MHRTTVYLPGRLRHKLDRIARQRGVPEAEVMRSALEHELAADDPRPAFPFFRSGDKTPFAERDEELLKDAEFDD